MNGWQLDTLPEIKTQSYLLSTDPVANFNFSSIVHIWLSAGVG